MPRHKGRIGRLLDEEVGGPAQEIRAVQILDRVEDRAAPHELGEPGKQQVRFMTHIARERPARPPLERLDPPRSPAASVSDMIRIGKTQPSSRDCSIWAGVSIANSAGRQPHVS